MHIGFQVMNVLNKFEWILYLKNLFCLINRHVIFSLFVYLKTSTYDSLYNDTIDWYWYHVNLFMLDVRESRSLFVYIYFLCVVVSYEGFLNHISLSNTNYFLTDLFDL